MKDIVLPLARGLSVGIILFAVITFARIALRKLNAEKEIISWMHALEGMAFGSMLTLVIFAVILREKDAVMYCLGTMAPISALLLFEQTKRLIAEVKFRITFRKRVATMDMEELREK